MNRTSAVAETMPGMRPGLPGTTVRHGGPHGVRIARPDVREPLAVLEALGGGTMAAGEPESRRAGEPESRRAGEPGMAMAEPMWAAPAA